MNFKQYFYSLLKEEYKWINGDLYKNGVKITNNDEIEANQDAEELETVSITGEYWFDNHGTAMYADGDIGDMNHEAYVIQQCSGEVASEFNVDIGDEGLYSDSPTENEIIEIIMDEMGDEFLSEHSDKISGNNKYGYEPLDENDIETQELLREFGKKIEDVKNDPADAMIDYLIKNNNFDKQAAYELVMTAYGSLNDAREYAINNWGWSRVHGDSIETKTLTKDSLKNIASGLSDAMQQEGLWDNDEYTEEQINLHEYTISTYSGKRYTITYEDMERGDVSELEEDLIIKKSAATEYLRKQDIEDMPEYYRNKGVIGDSVKY